MELSIYAAYWLGKNSVQKATCEEGFPFRIVQFVMRSHKVAVLGQDLQSVIIVCFHIQDSDHPLVVAHS